MDLARYDKDQTIKGNSVRAINGRSNSEVSNFVPLVKNRGTKKSVGNQGKKFLCRRGSFYSHPKLNKLTLIQSVLKNQQRGLSKLVDLHRENGLNFDKPKFLLLLFGGE